MTSLPKVGLFAGGVLGERFHLLSVDVRPRRHAVIFAALTNSCDFASGDGVVDVVRSSGLRVTSRGTVVYKRARQTIADADSFGLSGRRIVTTVISAKFVAPGRVRATARVRSRFVDRRGRTVGNCDTGTVAWRALRVPGRIVPGAELPSGSSKTYYGASAQRLPLIARRAADGTLELALAWRLRCIPGAKTRQTRVQGLAATNGVFRATKRITEPAASVRDEPVVTFRHSVAAAVGERGLTGRWRIDATVRRPDGTRTKCSTGANRLRAAAW